MFTRTSTAISPLILVGAMKLPETGGMTSGWRCTATAMWSPPTGWPLVESKPRQPVPGR